LTKLEIEHGIMTAFYTEPSWVKLTSQGVSFLIEPRVRSSAVNFVISGLQRDKEFSYEIRFGEPPTSYDLDYLAPFLITAKHHGLPPFIFNLFMYIIFSDCGTTSDITKRLGLCTSRRLFSTQTLLSNASTPHTKH
jgi:hypothetical protein